MNNSPEHITQLAIRYQEPGADQDAIYSELLESFTPLITKLTYTRTIPAADQDDVAQTCRLALHKALNEFDPKREVYFSTYVSRHMHWAIGNEIKAKTRRQSEPKHLMSLDAHETDREPASALLMDPDTCDGFTAAALVERTQARRGFWLLLRARLSELERQVLTATLAGASNKEVPMYLDESCGNVSVTAVSQAMARIKRKAGELASVMCPGAVKRLF